MESCSSCGKSLWKNDDKVTTDSGVKFHRACLEQLLNPKHKTKEEVCDKSASLLAVSLKNISNTFLCIFQQETTQLLNIDLCFQYEASYSTESNDTMGLIRKNIEIYAEDEDYSRAVAYTHR